jgi:hypothetical protein
VGEETALCVDAYLLMSCSSCLVSNCWKNDKEHNIARRNTNIRTRETIHHQLSINAERQQFPHPQQLTPDDDHF